MRQAEHPARCGATDRKRGLNIVTLVVPGVDHQYVQCCLLSPCWFHREMALTCLFLVSQAEGSLLPAIDSVDLMISSCLVCCVCLYELCGPRIRWDERDCEQPNGVTPKRVASLNGTKDENLQSISWWLNLDPYRVNMLTYGGYCCVAFQTREIELE